MLFIEQHKSGFERPADVEFEDYTQGIKAATSDSSLNPPRVRAKLWPFNKKNKVNLHTSLHSNHICNFGGLKRAVTAGRKASCSTAEGISDLKEFHEQRAGHLPGFYGTLLRPEVEHFHKFCQH